MIVKYMTKKEFELILSEGEGYKIEFKEKLSGIDKELVAFANSSGGRIFVGVSDNGEIKKISRNDNDIKSQIQDIESNCQPPINIIIERYNDVLIIHIPEGADKPYQCSSGFYLRIGPNSQKMGRNQIIEFIKSEGKLRFDELECSKFNYSIDFDKMKLNKYLKIAGISKLLDNRKMMMNLNVADIINRRFVVNNTGALFFTKVLDRIYSHTAVTCVLYKGKDKSDILDRRDFNEDIISSIDSAMIFLKQHIPVRYKVTGAVKREEYPEIPFSALREAVINAVAHRDYFEHGAGVNVEIFDDRIVISNPGGLVKGLDPEDFGKRSVLRNPNIASLLYRLRYIEKLGTGIVRMRKALREAKLPPPKFAFSNFFTVLIRRPIAKLSKYADSEFGEKFGNKFGEKFGVRGKRLDRIITIIELLSKGELISASGLSENFNISKRMIEKDLSFLRNNKMIEFKGPAKTGKYYLTETAKRLLRLK